MTKIVYKKMGAYGAADTDKGIIYINKAKNKSGIEYLDTMIHERLHIAHPKMSEKEAEDKAMKQRLSILSII